MAGRLLAIVLALFACLPCATGFAEDQQESPTPQPSPGGNSSPPHQLGGDREKRNHPIMDLLRNAKSVQEANQLIDRLPPGQREKFRENFQRWQNMTPDERKELREREDSRRQKMLQEADGSIQQSGLNLDKDSRDKYILRYILERRKIEQQLQRELEEKRKPLIEDMVKRLQVEFKSAATPAPSASPSAQPSATPTP
jgi:hypothetical protein